MLEANPCHLYIIPLIMDLSKEQANWARHYDLIRIGITSVLLTLSFGAITAVFALRDKKKLSIAVCISTVFVGFFLIALGCVYQIEYHDSSLVSIKLKELALKYHDNGCNDFCRNKIRKKKLQELYESYYPDKKKEPDAIANMSCQEADQNIKDIDIIFKKNVCAYIYKTIKRPSAWFWVNSILGIGVPFILIIVILRRMLN